MTIDSSKDYSTSSSEEDSSWDINHSHQSTKICTPTSIVSVSSEPIGPLVSHQTEFSTDISRKTSSTNNSKKILRHSLSIDDQASNGIMMIAPLETAAHSGSTEDSSITKKLTIKNNTSVNINKLTTTSIKDTTMLNSIDKKETTPTNNNNIAATSIPIELPTPSSIDPYMPDFSMFDLINQTSRQFVLKPATAGLQIKCQIYRQKVDFFFPFFFATRKIRKYSVNNSN